MIGLTTIDLTWQSYEGNLIIHNSKSRSQKQNREIALARLAQEVRKALYIPKIRMKTRISKRAKEARLEKKAYHSKIKKMRKINKFDY